MQICYGYFLLNWLLLKPVYGSAVPFISGHPRLQRPSDNCRRRRDIEIKLSGIHSLLNETGTSSIPKGLGNVYVGGVVFDKFAMIVINKRTSNCGVFCMLGVSIWTDDPTLDPLLYHKSHRIIKNLLRHIWSFKTYF